jgi:hypothetical protein
VVEFAVGTPGEGVDDDHGHDGVGQVQSIGDGFPRSGGQVVLGARAGQCAVLAVGLGVRGVRRRSRGGSRRR